MKILVTGCGGMLGEAVFKELNTNYTLYATDIDVNEYWLTYMDVRNADSVDTHIRMINPDVVIHLAALTDMEYCELNPRHAYDVNFVGANNVARLSAKNKSVFVYISSAGVFDGGKQVYYEHDMPNPLNVYAKSKYAGELAAMSYTKSIVIRAGWMMGGGPMKDKKFVNKIIKQIRGGATELFVVKDKMGTPTYTYDLAKTIRNLIESRMYGMYHGACDGGGSRVDIAKEIVKDLGIEDKVKVTAVTSEHFKKEYFAERPFSERLESNKLAYPGFWRDRLQDYISRFEWKV